MGRVAIIDTKTGQTEVFDTEKDCIKLTLRLVETGAVHNPNLSTREVRARIASEDRKETYQVTGFTLVSDIILLTCLINLFHYGANSHQ